MSLTYLFNPSSKSDDEFEDFETIRKTLPPLYHGFVDVFSPVWADKLPPHRSYNHLIKLTGPAPPPGLVYSLSKQESLELRDYIDENVAKGFLKPSKSQTGSPVLFVPKKDGTLRLCVDYRKLNNVTRKDAYPVPPMSHLLTLFHGATYFSKLDLRGAYNLIRIAEGCEYLTAMRTRFGSLEYTVMPFGLCNAPFTFQHFVNDIFADRCGDNIRTPQNIALSGTRFAD